MKKKKRFVVFINFFSKVRIFWKNPQKFETISHLIWRLPSEIVSNFVAFLENLNFTPYSREQKHVSIKNPILLTEFELK